MRNMTKTDGGCAVQYCVRHAFRGGLRRFNYAPLAKPRLSCLACACTVSWEEQ
jgi:hypothetical protein